MIGSSLVWVRGTNANVVQLFVGRGFHDAFARAHEVDAATLQRWIDSVRALTPLPASDTIADDAQLRSTILSADVTMLRRVGGPFSGLRLLMSGEDPITMPEPTAKDFLAALDSAARVARELSPPPVAAAPTVVAVAPPVPVVVSPPTERAPTPLEASMLQPPPELVLPEPKEPVVLLASRVEIMPLPIPVVAAPIARPSVAPAPVVAAPVVAAPVVAAPVVAAPVVTKAPTPAPAPAPDTVVTPHFDVPADKLIHTPLGPFTIPGALLADREKEAQYCYRQLGLKYSPDLKGEITVKLSLGGDGTVQEAVVTKRNWQGISAGEVEACVRALARDWNFPASDPAITDGSKLLTFSFAP